MVAKFEGGPTLKLHGYVFNTPLLGVSVFKSFRFHTTLNNNDACHIICSFFPFANPAFRRLSLSLSFPLVSPTFEMASFCFMHAIVKIL